MNRFNVPSSHLQSVGWETINGIPVLEVEFKNGHIYRYSNVPELHFLALTHMPSGVGTYFNQNIKGQYPTERIYKMSAPESITGGTQMSYDCTVDVLKHKHLVGAFIHRLANNLHTRALFHDDSKLVSPEKEMFDKWTPELKTRVFGSDYYKQALDAMGDALKHHYENNSHHPEHYANGVDDMDLLDVIEMFCDWRAASQAKGVAVDLEHAAQRFNLSPQIVNILKNTMQRFP